ncbi:hypothetical protein [Algibacter pacificus]|uniref:hypothetical protein n=1 Tax=Algibacter pacificus TaxID=2599389 RepID=UPI0011C743A7|nr:hypothetical protein [Algibacter pacificus]
MKKIENYILLAIMIIFSSCSNEERSFTPNEKAGFEISYSSDEDLLTFTRNLEDESVDLDVNIKGEWFVDSGNFSGRVILVKSLLNSKFEKIESVFEDSELILNDTIEFSIETEEELFKGLSVSINEIEIGSKFRYEAIGITPESDTIVVNTSHTFEAKYNEFCDRPVLELGTWIATNTKSNYSKEVTLYWDESRGAYAFTDFGLDWSKWNDYWYGVLFNFACPPVEGDPVEFDFLGDGVTTQDTYEMLDDNGVLKTRRLRLMPYIYKEGSPKGYYDSETQEIVFKDINVTDDWWNSDKHDLISMVFKKKNGNEPEPKTPPFSGTVHLNSDIIKSSDPTTFQSISYTGRGERRMFDRRSTWVDLNAFLFNVAYSDGLNVEVQVNPEFETQEEAKIFAEKYAVAIGRIPKALRTGVQTVWIHKGDYSFGGGNNNILIHAGRADRYDGEGKLEETLVHEGTHASIDSDYKQDPEWLASQQADGNFISTYARDNPTTEDLAESLLMWIAVTYRADRVPQDLIDTINETMPNRINFFDNLNLDMELLK